MANSAPRIIRVIALDQSAEQVAGRLAQKSSARPAFVSTSSEPVSERARDRFGDLAGAARNMFRQVSEADHVVTVSIAGEDAEGASIVGEACAIHKITMTALILDPAGVPNSSLLKTMMPLRAHATTLVVAKDEEYVEAMLTALRA